MAIAERQPEAHTAWRAWYREGEILAERGGKTLIVGLGSTGLAVAVHLAERRRSAFVVDSRSAPPGLAGLRSACPDTPVVLETLDPRWLADIDEVVLSPGLPIDTPIVEAASERGIPVVSDIELFAREARAPVLAVTGSNGKSTVVTLVARILAAQGKRVPAGGNLGPPALELLRTDKPEAYVLEISSFQMETTHELRPLAAALLNVSADHLDRHGSFERYAELKAKLLHSAEQAVFNWDDPVVREMGRRHSHGIPYSTREPVPDGYSVVVANDERWLARGLEPIMPAAQLRLPGRQGEANALAALALAEVLGGEPAPALEALRQFEGLPHRFSPVATVAGVAYVDDSKGTNVGATVAALESLSRPAVLIAGGLGKGMDFTPLARAARDRLKAAVLLGESAPALAEALAGICPIARADTMQAAVARAAGLATAGDTVLLSPACASQDMFADYRERGRTFAAAVRELER